MYLLELRSVVDSYSWILRRRFEFTLISLVITDPLSVCRRRANGRVEIGCAKDLFIVYRPKRTISSDISGVAVLMQMKESHCAYDDNSPGKTFRRLDRRF